MTGCVIAFSVPEAPESYLNEGFKGENDEKREDDEKTVSC